MYFTQNRLIQQCYSMHKTQQQKGLSAVLLYWVLSWKLLAMELVMIMASRWFHCVGHATANEHCPILLNPLALQILKRIDKLVSFGMHLAFICCFITLVWPLTQPPIRQQRMAYQSITTNIKHYQRPSYWLTATNLVKCHVSLAKVMGLWDGKQIKEDCEPGRYAE